MSGRDSVFISYSHKDREIVIPAIRIQKDLRDAAYFDVYNISPGSHWRREIANAIRSAEVFILCWSKNAADSKEVEREWQCALDNRTRIIPVLLDETSLPDQLKHIQALTTLRQLVPKVQKELREIYWTSKQRPHLLILESILAVIATFVIALPFWKFFNKDIAALAPPDLMLLALSAVLYAVAYHVHRKVRQWSQLKDALDRAVIDEMKTQYGRRDILFAIEDAWGWEAIGRCPYCNELLRTSRARQCRSCGQDWHGSDVKAIFEWSKDGRSASQASSNNEG
jgi:hypothetical protein